MYRLKSYSEICLVMVSLLILDLVWVGFFLGARGNATNEKFEIKKGSREVNEGKRESQRKSKLNFD